MQTYLALATHPMLWVFLGLLAGFYLILWATALDARRLAPRTLWLRRNYPAVILTGVAILAIVALTFYLIEIGISVRVLVDRLRETALDPGSQVGDLQSLASAVAILVGVLAAAATILYSSIRVWINERTATATEEGLITDRINKAVQGLGAEKTENRLGRTVRYTVGGVDGSYFEWIDEPRQPPSDPDVVGGKVRLTNEPWSSFPNTRPNLEVRIGSVYALERIAQDSPRDHTQIMEILCAYVRHNAPFDPETSIPEDWEDAYDEAVDADWDDGNILIPNEDVIRDWFLGHDRPREDIQVAMTVIGRRSPLQLALEGHWDSDGNWHGYRLDLRRTCLTRIDLEGADLANARFTGCQMHGGILHNAQLTRANFHRVEMLGADLRNAQMQGVNLRAAQLQGANLTSAHMNFADISKVHMQGAILREAKLRDTDLGEAQMQGADLWEAQMQGADLNWAQMQGADLREAQMQGADLNWAQMQGADLWRAQMQGADLREAQMQGADLREAQMQGADLREAQMQGADLREAQMQGANLWRAQMDGTTNLSAATLRGAALRLVDCSDIIITQDQIDSIFGDQTVILHKGLIRPDWPEIDEFDWAGFESQWRAWQAEIGFDPDDPKTW
ncbi:pentapeptide repeat-containing protein [Sedimentitalea todarodis]|uniref:Pentapeptide repeat-containing protein n=1 Tax=Sedimentitalea todarodis TaxID=1631240 RepID=A0ABU3VC37_9RHOB|nr:pentapeptide repeat-containing protein [Sedimentitalea todarodis]MDU9003595.1 pentapeptide repeat-containing protein [Sedimentitalea todarodis]